MKQLEKELNEMFTILFQTVFMGFGHMIRCIFKGLTRMRGWQWLGFLGAVAGSYFVYRSQTFYQQRMEPLGAPGWVVQIGYIVLLALPVWYVLLLGIIQEMRQKEIQKQFEAVGFRSKDGMYPYLIKRTKDRQGLKKSKKYKEVYVFRANIPMSEWMNAKERIETAIDRNIICFSEGRSKKVCQIITVPAGCRIPVKVDWHDGRLASQDGVMVLGETALEQVTFDLNRTPHVLAAGETGSGKSVVLRLFLWQFLCKGAKVYMFDFKGGVEFGKRYEQFGEVVTERKRAIEVFQTLYDENEKRLKLFRDLEVKNLTEYNYKTGENLCRIGAFCDEIAEMMDRTGLGKEERNEVETLQGLISSLARLSRATGINLILGMQRPDAKVLTGQIKNNIPVRICGRFADRAASEIVLGNTDAVFLPDIKGRFLFRLGNITEQVQAYLFDDDLHMHQDVPEAGQMLLDGGQEKTKEQGKRNMMKVQETSAKKCVRARPGGITAKEVSEKDKQKEANKVADEARKLELSSKKLADTQEEFSFSWSCERKESDD